MSCSSVESDSVDVSDVWSDSRLNGRGRYGRVVGLAGTGTGSAASDTCESQLFLGWLDATG